MDPHEEVAGDPDAFFDFLDKVHQTAAEGRFRRGIQLDHELQEEIVEEKERILEHITKVLRHRPKKEDEAVHPLYEHLILKTHSNGQFAKKHLMSLSPIDPDGIGVWNNLEELARKIADNIPNEIKKNYSKARIKTLLLLNGILNTRVLNNANIIVVGYGEHSRRCSPKDIFDYYKKIKRGGQTPENASLSLCRALGLFPNENRAEHLKMIQEKQNKAWRFLSSMIEHMNEKLRAMPREKGETIKLLSIDAKLQQKTLFEWVGIMLDPNENAKKRIESHLLLKFTLEFYNIEESREYIGSKELKARIAEAVQSNFEEDVFTQVHYNRLNFDKNGSIENVEENCMVEDARTIVLEDKNGQFKRFSKQVMVGYFDDKKSDSILTKLITRQTEGTTENIKDHLRCTLVLPDVTLQDFENDENAKPYAHSILMKIGSSTGLVYREHSSIDKEHPLGLGEFTIEENLDSSILFKNIKLLGNIPNRKDDTVIGSTLEIMLNTIDLHEVLNGNNSPFDHQHYEDLRMFAAIQNCFPRSHYKQGHACLGEHIRSVNARRERASISAKAYLKRPPSQNSSAAA